MEIRDISYNKVIWTGIISHKVTDNRSTILTGLQIAIMQPVNRNLGMEKLVVE